jgi:hypothetical protein
MKARCESFDGILSLKPPESTVYVVCATMQSPGKRVLLNRGLTVYIIPIVDLTTIILNN